MCKEWGKGVRKDVPHQGFNVENKDIIQKGKTEIGILSRLTSKNVIIRKKLEWIGAGRLAKYLEPVLSVHEILASILAQQPSKMHICLNTENIVFNA